MIGISCSPSAGCLKTISLFSGAGGLDLGFELAGFEPLLCVENDKDCCATLRANRPRWRVADTDVRDVGFAPYAGRADAVIGGFPCQPFSHAGKRLGLEDVRGTLFHEFARCVSETKPAVFVAENVRGLVTHDDGRTLEVILGVFGSLGYSVRWKVLNAAYYGVGQKRERIFIVGLKDGEGFSFEYPEPSERMTTLREVLEGCPESPGASYSGRKRTVLELVPQGGCWADLPESVARAYMGKSYYAGGGKRGVARRIAWDEPCLTLMCSPSQMQTERCHPDETRPFTVRECARIQSFPDDWEFCGSLSSQYRQIGNAVPVKLAEAVAGELRAALPDAGGQEVTEDS